MNAQALEMTDNAANKVRQLRDSEGNQELMLRVYVTGGGCSGFSYGFNFAESMNEDDAEFIYPTPVPFVSITLLNPCFTL